MHYDHATPSLSMAVLEAVAAREQGDPTTLPPLHEVVNPEALDALFASRFDGTDRDGGRVTFPYAGYTVAVRDDGHVELHE